MLGASIGPLGALQLGQLFGVVEPPDVEVAVIEGFAAYSARLLGQSSVEGAIRGRGSLDGNVTGFVSVEE